MVQVPADVVENPNQELVLWYQMREQLSKLKTAESLLRKRLFGHFFPTPTEGTNNYTLPDGFVLKAKHTIIRDIDEPAFLALKPKFEENGINADVLVRRKPELCVTPYRELTAEQMHLFDQCLIIKPGSPQMEIAKPAGRRASRTEK